MLEVDNSEVVLWLFTAALGYLLGSIPFGYLLTRLAGLGDIRQVGSGNIGATNVLRTGKRWLAALTLFLDGGKGALAVIAGAWLGDYFETSWLSSLAGVAALLGHLYPVWLKFKGGKGVAAALGVLLAMHWPSGLAVCATWLVVALLFRFSSLAALSAFLLAPLYGWLLQSPVEIWLMIAIMLLIWVKHQANIMRLLQGIEPRINLQKKNAEPPST